MAALENYLARLKEHRAVYADEVLSRPTPGEFHHGYTCGYVAALKQAEKFLEDVLADKDEQDKHERQRHRPSPYSP